MDDSIDVEARSYAVQAQVVGRERNESRVAVRFEWLGDPIQELVSVNPAPAIGEPIEVLIDPEQPTRVWAPGEYAPGGDLVGLVYLLGIVVFGAGAISRIATRRRNRYKAPGQ